MFSIRKLISLGLVGAICLGAAIGCGSSNNDQGTSFLAFGWFEIPTGDEEETEEPKGVAFANAPLSTDVSGISIALPNGVVLAGDGLAVYVSMGLRNFLAEQTLRIVRIDCSHQVPGASSSLRIPTDSFPVGVVLGPVNQASSGSDTTGGTTGVLDQIVYYAFPIITSEMYAFLNVNRTSLPELPFRVVSTCTATGVSQSGAVYTTNELNFTTNMLEVSECCTGTGASGAGGFQEGTGTGGDFDSFSDETEEGSSETTSDTSTVE